MKRFSAIPLLVLVSVVFMNVTYAQLTPADGTAFAYISKKKGPFAEANISPNNLRVSSHHVSSLSKVRHVYFQQLHDDIEILHGQASLHIADDEVIYAHNELMALDNVDIINGDNLAPLEAIERCASHYGLPRISQTTELSKVPSANRSYRSFFRNPAYSHSDISTQLKYILIDNKLILTQEVILDLTDRHERWAAYVSLADRKIILEEAHFLECSFEDHGVRSHHESHQHTKRHHVQQQPISATASYNVYAAPIMAPNEGNRSIVTDPWLLADINGISPSPFGWHDLDGIPGADTTITLGNNVHAVDDLDGNNTDGLSPDGGTNLNFDFDLSLDQSPETYTAASTVNLFYTTNRIHDVMVHYGFDEAAGNFQQTNFTGQGIGNDAVRAECQDGASTNNARFFRTIEGFAPRIEMYEWTPTTTVQVTNSIGVTSSYNVVQAEFGARTANITSELALSQPLDACNLESSTSMLSGKIALVERGSCSFEQKARNVQDQGAVAMVVCHNVPGGGAFTISGSDPSIHIPVVMVSYANCQTLKTDISSGPTTAQINITDLRRDASLDNGVIAHEYGHGISQRLTGGSGTLCLGGREQMGEGWSDYYALMFHLKASDTPEAPIGVASYLRGESPSGSGIRTYPYSTDMAINPLTYEDLEDGISYPHGVGTVWCAMLWDMTWNLIGTHGFSDNVYDGQGGNGISLKLVTEGLKLQPCNPGFVDGRDAILKADTLLFQGANSCEIWRAFAKRGLGFGADQRNQDNLHDGLESYEVPTGCSDYPCTDESLVYMDTSIPHGTDRRARTTITISDCEIDSLSSIILSASQSLSVMGELTIDQSSELTIMAENCDQ